MSLTTRKSKAQAQASAGVDRARKAATRVTPLARNAGTTAAQGVQGARTWAAPRIEKGVRETRRWAAPRIEQAADGLQQNVVPKVSGLMKATAHRIEPAVMAPKRRLWPRLVAGIALVTAAGGAIAAVFARRKARPSPDAVVTDITASEDEMSKTAADKNADQEMAEAGRNGRGPRR